MAIDYGQELPMLIGRTPEEKKALREAICKEAKDFLPTPYVDHAAKKHCGVDCAGFPMLVMQAVGLVPLDYKLPPYSPQQWLNHPTKSHVVDETMITEIKKFAVEITETEIQSGDLMLVLMVNSWTHGAIILDWPNYVLHPVRGLGVIGSHALNEGFWAKRKKRFFSFVEK
jgi:cell wall-associated NlpC family hydrolase